MSVHSNARATAAIAKNAGFRWCSTCQSDKPAEGFIKQGRRWICAGCLVRRANREPGTWITRGVRS